MRRILFALTAIFMFVAAGTAFAGVLTDDFYRQSGYSSEYDYWGSVAGGTNGTTLNDRMYTALGKWGFNSTSSLNDRLLAWSGKIARNPSLSAQDNLGRMSSLYKGLMFYKSFQDRGTTTVPEFSGGSVTATFTASRDSTHPATYFDANGVMQVTTTSDAIRNTQGYYDATGWHSAPGLLLEGASTNYVLNSYFSIDTNSDGLADSWGSDFGTKTLEECSMNGIASGKSQKNVHTFASTVTQYNSALDQTTANDSFDASGANINCTVSFWARGDLSGITTGASLNDFLYIQAEDNSNVGQQYFFPCKINTAQGLLSTTSWVRFSFTVTVTDTDVRRMDLRWLYFGNSTRPTTGENFWLEIYGVQIEKQAYPSSFIPTTTAALTRNAESLSYASSGNFPAPSGGNCLSFDGQNASGDDYVSIPNSATGNQAYGSTAYSVEAWVFVRSDGEGDQGRIIDKSNQTSYGYNLKTSGQSGSNVNIGFTFIRSTTNADASTTSSVPINVWNHIAGVFDGTNAPKIYVNGTEASYSGSPTGGSGTFPDDSSLAANIGNTANTARTFDGFIQSVRIYRNKALSAGEVTTAYNAGRYASLPVTGCTAQYLFNEGTGSTLTDGVAGNNGTISGAAWSKDTHAGTILMKYRPIALPSELNYAWLFDQRTSSGSSWIILQADALGLNRIFLQTQSNNNALNANPSSSFTWVRYSSNSLIAAWSVVADENGKKLTLYNNGVLAATNSSFAVSPGVLNSSFYPKNSSPMILEAIGIWNRALSAAEVAAVYADQSR